MKRKDKRNDLIVITSKKNKRTQILITILLILVTISVTVNVCSLYYIYHKKHVKIVVKKEKVTEIPENIVFLGDSITDYYDLEKYYKDYYVVNSGVSGNIAKDILDDMEERVYKYNPSKVFLVIGTNDIQRNISDKEIVKNIETIIENIKKNRKDTKIYLESIYPINNTDNDKINNEVVGKRTNEEIRKVNQQLKEYCDKEKITYIDMYKKLADDEGNLKIEYTKEGLHISDKGYELITDVIKDYI